MHEYPADIYTEPGTDPNTLANLGPGQAEPMALVARGRRA